MSTLFNLLLTMVLTVISPNSELKEATVLQQQKLKSELQVEYNPTLLLRIDLNCCDHTI